jgi:SAM-dependent methyltransferase
MHADARRAVRQQYHTTDPLIVRVETHRRFEERHVDLDAEATALLCLTGDETIVDVGCGPGRFPCYLRTRGHRGLLVGMDQSRAMLAEAQRAAREHRLALGWLRGDATVLPLADASVDWVVARHMLYHVPDIPRALGEFQRVLHPGGRIVLSTNSRYSLPHIRELERDLATGFGLHDPGQTDAPFCMENAPDILAAAGLRVTEHIIHNALVFTTPDPVVAFVASMVPANSTAAEPTQRGAVLRWLEAEAARRLRALGGVWRDPKDVAFYVCAPHVYP